MPKLTDNNKKQKQDKFVSAVIVAKQDDKSIATYCRKLVGYLDKNYTNFEVIIIDNDYKSENIAPVIDLLTRLPCLRIIRLSRRHQHDSAIMSGLESAIGDYVIVLDPSLDPISNIKKIISINQRYDIVQGIADIEDSSKYYSSIGRRLFYWYSRRYLGIDVPVQSTYCMALSRRAINAITVATRNQIFVRHTIKTIGYSYKTFRYKTKEDPVRSTRLKTGVTEALDIISSHSTHPLRVMSWVGFMASIINLLYAGYVIAIALFKGNVAEGWTTMSLQLSAMFFILFIFMLILSEYIGKILAETRHDSRFLIMDELTSTVSISTSNKANITKES